METRGRLLEPGLARTRSDAIKDKVHDTFDDNTIEFKSPLEVSVS